MYEKTTIAESLCHRPLTHCGIVKPYNDIELGQHWFRYWLVAWWHQAITWINVDLSSATTISGQFHRGYLSNQSFELTWKWISKILFQSPRSQWVEQEREWGLQSEFPLLCYFLSFNSSWPNIAYVCLIFLVLHICMANPSISLIPQEEDGWNNARARWVKDYGNTEYLLHIMFIFDCRLQLSCTGNWQI